MNGATGGSGCCITLAGSWSSQGPSVGAVGRWMDGRRRKPQGLSGLVGEEIENFVYE